MWVIILTHIHLKEYGYILVDGKKSVSIVMNMIGSKDIPAHEPYPQKLSNIK
jgi:hypothetical protein